MDNPIAITPIQLDTTGIRWALRLDAAFVTARTMIFVGASVFVTTLFVLGGV